MKDKKYVDVAKELFPENVVNQWLSGNPLFSVIDQFLLDSEEHGLSYELTQEPYSTVIKPLLK